MTIRLAEDPTPADPAPRRSRPKPPRRLETKTPPKTPLHQLVHGLLQAERIVTRTLRPVCPECGGRKVWSVARPERGTTKGGPTNVEAESNWKARAVAAEEEARFAMEAVARAADRALDLETRLAEAERIIDAAGRPAAMARAVRVAADLVTRLSADCCLGCHRDLTVRRHAENCPIPAALARLEEFLSPAKTRAAEPAPTADEGPHHVARVDVGQTLHGRIRAAVERGEIPPRFSWLDVVRVIDVSRRTARSHLSNHAEGNSQGAPAYFRRVARGRYELAP